MPFVPFAKTFVASVVKPGSLRHRGHRGFHEGHKEKSYVNG